jgi:hypothetical protein
MPAIIARGGMSAQAFGWTTLNKKNFIGLYGNNSASNINSFASTIDASGNIYMVGIIQTGGFPWPGIIVKYNSKGVLLWQQTLTPGTSEVVYFKSVTVNSSGDVFIAGTFYDNYNYLCIVKYSSSGVYQYVKTLHTGGQYQDGNSIAIDNSDNIFIVGITNDSFGIIDTILIKYDSSGTLQWQIRLFTGTTEQSSGYSIVLDNSGNIYICGDGNISGGSITGILTVKCNSAGTILWQKLITSGTPVSYGRAVAVDSSGNVWSCGSIGSTSSILFVAKYDSAGNILGSQSLDSYGLNSYATSIVLDNSGNAYVCGYAYESSGLNFNFQILKLDSSLSVLWQRSLGGTGTAYTNNEYAVSIKLDNLGNFFVLGYVISGATQFLFAKLPTSGALTGTYTVGTYPVLYAASSGVVSGGGGASSNYSLSTTPSSFTEQTPSWSDASVSQTSTVKYI